MRNVYISVLGKQRDFRDNVCSTPYVCYWRCEFLGEKYQLLTVSGGVAGS